MIFPSSGQTVHNVQIAFPASKSEKSGSKPTPKFVRSDSEKRIPVFDVEKTAQGQKVKFVHHGIRMVVYEDSRLTKEDVSGENFAYSMSRFACIYRCSLSLQIIKTVKPANAQLDKPSTHSTGLITKPPLVHVHNSDELMPTFIEKLTVGKYSPEKSVHNYLHGTGKQITDSFSYLSGVSPPRSPQSGLPGDNLGKGLLLDQYLNIHTYPGFQDTELLPALGSRDSRDRGSLHMASLGEFDGPQEAQKTSPKRVEVPLLDMEGHLHLPQSSKSTKEAPAATQTAPVGAPTDVYRLLDSAGGKLAFDDSAPTSAIPGPKKPPVAELTKQLSTIPDQPTSKAASPRATHEHTPLVRAWVRRLIRPSALFPSPVRGRTHLSSTHTIPSTSRPCPPSPVPSTWRRTSTCRSCWKCLYRVWRWV
jgi:hypothetical protein